MFVLEVWFGISALVMPQTLLLSYKITALHSEGRGNFRINRFRGWHSTFTMHVLTFLSNTDSEAGTVISQ